MANNKLRGPFYLDRVAANDPRGYIVIDDISGNRAITIGYTEHPTGTSLETLLTDGDKRNYKVYKALLTQTSTGAPTATVLENNIGNIVWARTSEGIYTGTLSGAFVANKTFMPKVLSAAQGETAAEDLITATRTSANVITVNTTADGKLSGTPIEIQVYIVIDDISGN